MTAFLQVLPQALEKRMPHLPRSRLGAIFDLGEQLGLDPDAAMGNPFAIGLGLPDQRLEPGL